MRSRASGLHDRRPRGTSTLTYALGLASAGLILVPLALAAAGGHETVGHDPLAGLPRANAGSLEGAPAAATAPVVSQGRLRPTPTGVARLGGGDIPTGGSPSPLFGAESFTQKLFRFEAFGSEPLPAEYLPGAPMPQPADAQSCPDPGLIRDFLDQPMFPAPRRMANDTDENPWRPMIEQYLGRPLDTPPAEGRPPGEGWAHQRWSEFAPEVCYQTAQTGARVSQGVRDRHQRHRYELGEWGPGGLYHNTTGRPGNEGSTAGIEVRFHPNMPEQHPNALWTFDGTFPPKLLMARYGFPLLMRHYNMLPVDPAANFGFGLHTISTHEHNGHTPAESDGYTNAFFFPGQFYDYRWPMILAGHDSINTDASDPRAGAPDGNGGILQVPGDWRQTMSTHWFHDHMLDFTAQNVYKGNAAMMNYYSALDRGNEGLEDGINLRLPSGTALDWGNRDYDINLMIADKAWTQDGQLWFNIFELDGFLGDRLLTNWQYHPYLDVRARKYRFRILNGSVSRLLKLALVDQDDNPVAFHLVANDGNIMEHTVPFDGTSGTQRGILPIQGIAERYDIVVDFSQFQPGDRLYFVNVMEHDDGRRSSDQIPLNEILSGAYQPVIEDGEWEGGDPCVGKFLELRVHAYDGVDLSMDPTQFEPGGESLIPLDYPTQEEIDTALHRHFEFGRSSGTDSQPWTVKTDGGNGFGMDPRRLSAAPERGNLEIWRIENGGGGWAHPVHIHFEEGIILRRGDQPPPIWERWARKDLYRIGNWHESTDSVDIALRFRDFMGTYMEHCHNTQHEDHAMLLRWDIENPGQTVYLPTPIPTWDGVEYVNTVALPTARTGDGFGLDGDGPPPPPAPASFQLSITPGAPGLNTLAAQGTSGGLCAFLYGFVPGDRTVFPGPCPTGVDLGIQDLNLLALSGSVGDTALHDVVVPPGFSGLTVLMQALDVGACEPSNLVSHTF